jgi:hypothetical protein
MRGRDPSVPPRVDQRAQCERLEGLAQLPRNRVPRTLVNSFASGTLRYANILVGARHDLQANPQRTQLRSSSGGGSEDEPGVQQGEQSATF